VICRNCKHKQEIDSLTIDGMHFYACEKCGHDLVSGETLEEWKEKTPPIDMDEMNPADEIAFYGDTDESSSIQEPEAGQKFDTDKTQWDLTPWLAQTEVAEVLTYGAVKYSRDNWRHVPDAKRRYTAALFRHVVAWLRGEKCDPESGKHHLAHAACCILFMLEVDLEVQQ